jgi:hypothetical protein
MENMEDQEWIEKYFRKELTAEELIRFNERLAADPAFKRKVETESLVHKGLQFSRVREIIRAYPLNPILAQQAAAWVNNRAFITVGGSALAVWIFSTYSSNLTSMSSEYIKWVGLGLAIVGSVFILGLMNKMMNLRLGMAGIFQGLLVFVTASGIDAINQGVEGIERKALNEAYLVPYTENKAWWPTQSLEDSLEGNRKRILEMGEQIRTLVGSRINSRFNMNFGIAPVKFIPVVVPHSASVPSGTTYEADVFLGASPLRQTLEMRVDGKSIPIETDPDGLKKGKVSFTAVADKFDNTGTARKRFMAEIKMGDSTYIKVVEYEVKKPK